MKRNTIAKITDIEEYFIDILRRFRRRFHEQETILVGILLGFLLQRIYIKKIPFSKSRIVDNFVKVNFLMK